MNAPGEFRMSAVIGIVHNSECFKQEWHIDILLRPEAGGGRNPTAPLR